MELFKTPMKQKRLQRPKERFYFNLPTNRLLKKPDHFHHGKNGKNMLKKQQNGYPIQIQQNRMGLPARKRMNGIKQNGKKPMRYKKKRKLRSPAKQSTAGLSTKCVMNRKH
jgi:hypothetical protein